MGKLIGIAILVVAWIYGSGYFTFSESGVNDYLNNWFELTMQGDADGVCATAAKDMSFDIDDASMGRHMQVSGGKDDFCDYVRKTTPVMARMTAGVHMTRDNIKIERHGLHWWTADVTYVEHWTFSVGGGLSLESVSEDHVILVKTLSGVFLKRLESQSYLEKSS